MVFDTRQVHDYVNLCGIFSVDDLADICLDEGTRVADYGASSRFNGNIQKVKIDVCPGNK
jgi:hypothetical protein